MKNTKIIEILSALLILLWVYTAVSKLANAEEFRSQLNNQVFRPEVTKVLFYLIPFSELVAAALLLFRDTRAIGFLSSLVLMLGFTTYIILILTGAFHRVPCSCGGVLQTLGWKSHLVFNLVFTAIAASGLIFIFKERRLEN